MFTIEARPFVSQLDCYPDGLTTPQENKNLRVVRHVKICHQQQKRKFNHLFICYVVQMISITFIITSICKYFLLKFVVTFTFSKI